jgi:phenylacetate-CoA ligase
MVRSSLGSDALADFYTGTVSRFLFPLHERMKGHNSVAVRIGLEASQWWGAEQLAAVRLHRLRLLLERAYRQVPYYRRIMAARGITPDSITTLADIDALPFLTKPDIRAQSEALKARDAGRLTRLNTGGSSGEPLIFFVGRERISHDVAAKWRATRWWGVDIGDPEIVIWGSPLELSAQDRVRELRDRLLRTRLLPAFSMSTGNLDHFIRAIRSRRPRMLFGYPSSLALIARYARSSGQRMDDLGIRVAFVTAERLYEDQRAAIERTFGCPVANGYGGRDAGFIAHQCPRGGLHISAEDLLVEIVDPQGRVLPEGQAGEIVVTHFATGDFPFIRYRTGDIGVLGPPDCPCGRGLPVLREVQGRATDFVVAQDGTVMHGLALIYVIRDVSGIERFQIIQESLTRTRVLIEAGAAFTPAAADAIVAGLKRRLGSGVRIDVEVVDGIPAERSGKFRYVLCKVGVA